MEITVVTVMDREADPEVVLDEEVVVAADPRACPTATIKEVDVPMHRSRTAGVVDIMEVIEVEEVQFFVHCRK